MIGFRLPTHVHLVPGCRSLLPEAVRTLGVRSVLLAIDPGLRATPWPDQVTAILTRDGVRVVTYDRIEPNPRTTTAEAMAAVMRDDDLGAVVGLGGGSVLDAAKAAAMLATNPAPAATYVGPDRYPHAPRPFIAIPTTCGTGSEVTWVSVLTDAAARTKISVKGETMFPDRALVDGDLLTSLPADLVAWTGLDALTHALEAVTCNRANPVSDALAHQAIRLLFTHLPQAAADIAGAHEARAAVMRASTLAGIGFGNADVASVHCLSESLGGLLDVPHGLTNAILLRPMLAYNRPHIDPALARLHDLLAAQPAPEAPADARASAFLERLDQLLDGLRVPPFAHLGVSPDHHGEIARQATANGSNGSNARPMTEASYREVLGRLSTA